MPDGEAVLPPATEHGCVAYGATLSASERAGLSRGRAATEAGRCRVTVQGAHRDAVRAAARRGQSRDVDIRVTVRRPALPEVTGETDRDRR